jgi:integrase
MSADLQNQSLATITAERSIFAVSADPVENAIVLWAEGSTRPETRDREERLRDKQQIIRSFLSYVGKHPGEVEPMDVRVWRKHLESEKSENTVYSYLSRVSSFYEWLRNHPEIKDHIRGHPVSLGRPSAPRPYQTEKTKAWTDDEMNAILDQIAAEAERGSIHALRDYSVTLFYLDHENDSPKIRQNSNLYFPRLLAAIE